jgi:MEMO1 family protein
MTTTHISPYRGQWYPESMTELDSLLDEKYAESRKRTEAFLPAGLGFVVPHAGPAYSGTVAASVYRTLKQQQARRVVMLAFPHHGLLRGVAGPDVDAIATPLGEVRIDRPFVREFRVLPESRLCDHSFEIQLPFLQKSLPDAEVAPLYVGQLSVTEREDAADILAGGWQPGTVFVASSDFTHYGREFGHQPFPVDAHIAERLRELDFEYIDAAASLSSGRFLDTLERRRGNVCGAAPVALLLEVLKRLDGNGIYPTTLDYQTSGELTGDFQHSVSYAALGFHSRAVFELESSDREVLLDSAAETLRRLRHDGREEPLRCRGGSAALAAKRGTFVSLHRGEELLGCIGNLAGRHPLCEEVSHLALSAALDDSRFRPAGSAAGPIDIEISLLTPFRRIFGASDFQVGRHGGYLSLDGRSGLLLPQVAEGRDWTAEDFLHALERKSGLWKHAYRDPKARLYVFEAQVFSKQNAVV